MISDGKPGPSTRAGLFLIMLYKNISDRNQYIVSSSVKQLVPPGGVINLSQTDLRHAGSNIRNFESVYKAQEIVDELFRRAVESRGGKIDVPHA